MLVIESLTGKLKEFNERLDDLTRLVQKALIEMEAVKKENAKIQEAFDGFTRTTNSETLKQENARLREALEIIARRCKSCDELKKDAPCTCMDEPFSDQIARAALEGK